MNNTIEVRNLLARAKKELQAFGCDLTLFSMDYSKEKDPHGRVRYPHNHKMCRGVIISTAVVKDIELKDDVFTILLSGEKTQTIHASTVRFSVSVFNREDSLFKDNVNHISDIIRRLNAYLEPARMRYVDREVSGLMKMEASADDAVKYAQSLLEDLSTRANNNLFKLNVVFNAIVRKSIGKDVIIAGTGRRFNLVFNTINSVKLSFHKVKNDTGAKKINKIMLKHIECLRLHRSDNNISVIDLIKIKWLNHLLTVIKKEQQNEI